MSELVFDKLTFIDRLKSGGVSEDQARVHAEALDGAFRDGVATKDDMRALKSEIYEVKRDLRELEHRMTIRLGGMIALGVGAIGVLVKLL